MKCHYHPRARALSVCSACGVGLCRKCIIEDGDKIFCDSCYADGAQDDDAEDLEHAERHLEDEDYVDLELMDVLDSEDDDRLFP
jgi:hypothetical protein